MAKRFRVSQYDSAGFFVYSRDYRFKLVALLSAYSTEVREVEQ